MKRIILSVIVMAFAVAAQAGDAKTTQAKDQNQPSCCSSKMKTSMQTKEGTCPMAKTSMQTEEGTCQMEKTSMQTKEGTCQMVKTSMQTKEGTCPMAKGTCCKQKAVKQTALLSPKAAGAIR